MWSRVEALLALGLASFPALSGFRDECSGLSFAFWMYCDMTRNYIEYFLDVVASFPDAVLNLVELHFYNILYPFEHSCR